MKRLIMLALTLLLLSSMVLPVYADVWVPQIETDCGFLRVVVNFLWNHPLLWIVAIVLFAVLVFFIVRLIMKAIKKGR